MLRTSASGDIYVYKQNSHTVGVGTYEISCIQAMYGRIYRVHCAGVGGIHNTDNNTYNPDASNIKTYTIRCIVGSAFYGKNQNPTYRNTDLQISRSAFPSV